MGLTQAPPISSVTSCILLIGLIQDRNYEYRVQIVVDGIEQAFSDTNTYRPGTSECIVDMHAN